MKKNLFLFLILSGCIAVNAQTDLRGYYPKATIICLTSPMADAFISCLYEKDIKSRCKYFE